jgi:predicted transcriptional regulator
MQITLPLTIKIIFMLVFPCIGILLLTTWILKCNTNYKTFKMYTDLIVLTILLKLTCLTEELHFVIITQRDGNTPY